MSLWVDCGVLSARVQGPAGSRVCWYLGGVRHGLRPGRPVPPPAVRLSQPAAWPSRRAWAASLTALLVCWRAALPVG